MRPTLRCFGLFVAGVPVTLGAILLNETLWPVAIGYLLFALSAALLDGLQAARFSDMDIDVALPDTIYVGDREECILSLRSDVLRHSLWIDAVLDTDELLMSPSAQRGRLSPGEALELRMPIAPNRRGTARIHRLWLRLYSPLRLIEKWHLHPLDRSVAIVPNIRAVRRSALAFSADDALFGVKAQRLAGDGSEFDALRDYIPGLDHRAIDWKHSARHRKLVCKEFHTERNHQIVLAFDTGHLMCEPLDGIPRLDHAINAGLILGHASLRIGDRVGIYGFDSETRLMAGPVGGMRSFSRLQRLSASLAYRSEETNFTRGLMELQVHLKRRSLVILQTDFVDTITAELMLENLQRLAARHLVIFVTMRDQHLFAASGARPGSLRDVSRSVIAENFIAQRRIVFEKLDRMGIHCVDAPSTEIGSALLNRYIRIKQQELI